MHSQSRIKTLDILRFAAVLLVLGNHSYPLYDWRYGTALGLLSDGAHAVGGLGVDLFFVLSGFLVSGLLFKEYKASEGIDVKRFYVRRAFKIYPAFYVLIILTPLFVHPGTNCLSEVFFVQNYFPGLWYHTWSLGVEEHFYLLLPLLLLAIANRRKSFKLFPAFFLIAATSILAFRVWFAVTTEPTGANMSALHFQTHFRIDSLLFGALLSYYHWFEPSKLDFSKKRSRLCLLVAAMLVGLAVVLGKPYIASSLNSTVFYVAFGLAMLVAVNSERFMRFGATKIGRFLAYLGMHSYSIYLWHEPVRYSVKELLADPALQEDRLLINVIYVALSFAVGVLMAKIIEFPFLRLRDRIYTPKSKLIIGTGPSELPQQA